MDPDKIRAGGGKFQIDNESDHISMVCPSLPQDGLRLTHIESTCGVNRMLQCKNNVILYTCPN